LQGLAAAVRQFRHREAYEPISTGGYWQIGNPEVANLTREQRISFIDRAWQAVARSLRRDGLRDARMAGNA